jgi:hypothetical protein
MSVYHLELRGKYRHGAHQLGNCARLFSVNDPLAAASHCLARSATN